MKYCVSLVLRSIDDCKFMESYYKEFKCIKDLNNFIFDKVCNSYIQREIISLFFEVIK